MKESPELQKIIGLWSSVSLNMVQMCGVGPFITIPAMVAVFGGPQAIIGWIAGALLALCDGLIWAELGAALPGAGGTYVYLREAFQHKTGQLMPFLFVWTAILFVPLIMSTGVVGFVQYLGYFIPGMSMGCKLVIGLLLILVSGGLLWRSIDTIGRFMVGLWVIMLITVLAVIVAGFTHFHVSQVIDYPVGAFDLTSKSFWLAFAGGLTIGIYDYLGYNTSAYMAREVKKPGKVIPLSITLSIVGMMIIYLLMQVGMLGVIPWQEMIDPNNPANSALASVVIESTWGKIAADIMTALILICAFSSFTVGILSGSRVPFDAAKDGVFFNCFQQLHPTNMFPIYGLVVMLLMTMVGFVVGEITNLTALIQLLTTVMVIVQSFGQIAAFLLLRKQRPDLPRPYKMWLYPLPLVLAALGWLVIYLMADMTSPGLHPIELSLVWVVLGSLAFLLWARLHGLWPFSTREKKNSHE